ncbi:MAG: N-acetyltransferase [Flavobacteriales bacterium]|nr:N-acetyltransferase [Flavobacteriales bacterium]
MIHHTADVQTTKVGTNTSIWQFCVILKEAVIGDYCNINCHVFIENDVMIGDNVTIKSGVYIWDGIRIEDNVFIGPNVTFVNDRTPRSKVYPDSFLNTTIKRGASIGAAATILGGLEIGEYAMVGAGSVITKDVPARALFVGNPGRQTAWLNVDGSKMISEKNFFIDNLGKKWCVVDEKLVEA